MFSEHLELEKKYSFSERQFVDDGCAEKEHGIRGPLHATIFERWGTGKLKKFPRNPFDLFALQEYLAKSLFLFMHYWERELFVSRCFLKSEVLPIRKRVSFIDNPFIAPVWQFERIFEVVIKWHVGVYSWEKLNRENSLINNSHRFV